MAGLADEGVMGRRLGVNGEQSVNGTMKISISCCQCVEVPINPLGARLITSLHSAHGVPMCVWKPKDHLKIHYCSTWAACMIQVVSEQFQVNRDGG